MNIKYSIRFEHGKGHIDVQGIWVTGQEITAETPSFENIGPKENVEVKVSIKGGDFTITSSFFTYFLNTKAENTIAYGPGLLHDNTMGSDTVIVI
jgi:dynein heavy chain